jgi:acetamidase/formamidase
MQHFTSADHKYAYSPHHDPIGTVQPGETFTVDAVEGWSNYFRSPEDFTPEAYHAAEAVKWAVTGPIAVAGAEPGGVVAVTIHEVEVVTPGVCVYGPYADSDPLAWWDHETAVALYESTGGGVRFDEHTTLPSRPLVGCLAVAPAEGELHAMLQGRYGGNLDCKELVAGATLVLPYEHAGAGLYFGDCKALMSDGEIVGPPEVGALVTASAELRPRPASLRWPRLETPARITTIVAGTPLEWAARQAFRELLDWLVDDYTLPREKAALLMGMVADTGICQVSNTDFTAYCTMPREVLAPYVRPGAET